MTDVAATLVEDLPSVETDAQLELATLRRQVEALKRVAELKKAFGINFYRPHLKQHKFHTCDKIGRFLRTGNRFGKSECGIVETLSFCLGGRLFYREAFDILDGDRKVAVAHEGGKDHPFVTVGIPQRPIKALLLVVDWDMAKAIFTNQTDDPSTCGKIWKFLPKNSIGKVHLSRGGHIDQIEIKRPAEFGGGISVLKIDTIESWKHNKLGAESADWDVIHVDEPVPEAMFKGYSRGLMDRRGKYWFTCTPLDQMWMNDRFTPAVDKGESSSDGLAFDNKYLITGSIYDNPHRSDQGVADFEADLTEEEKQCRLFGHPLELAGRVYKEFVYDDHVLQTVPAGWEDFHLPPKNYTIRLAWDVCGARRPQAFLYCATAPDETVYVYDEQYFEPLMEPNLELAKRKIADRHVAAQLIDPIAMVKSAATDSYPITDLAATFELYFDPGSKDKTTGISSTKELLKERNPLTKRPRILFSPKLKRTLWEFSHYVYDTDKNEPKLENGDMLENLRRLVLNGLNFIEPPTDSDFLPREHSRVSHSDYHNSPNRVVKMTHGR